MDLYGAGRGAQEPPARDARNYGYTEGLRIPDRFDFDAEDLGNVGGPAATL
jgi:hypothetical protein